MGPGPSAKDTDIEMAFRLGSLIAQRGWVLLTGGMASGVMDAASRGANSAGGLVVGVLPTDDASGASEAVHIPIVTGMGSGRNNINILSSRVVITCGMGPGTASEAALAIKGGKNLILLGAMDEAAAFFKTLSKKDVHIAATPEEAIEIASELI